MVILFLFAGMLTGIAAASAVLWGTGSFLLALLAYSLCGASGGLLVVALIVAREGAGGSGSGPSGREGAKAPHPQAIMRPAPLSA